MRIREHSFIHHKVHGMNNDCAKMSFLSLSIGCISNAEVLISVLCSLFGSVSMVKGYIIVLCVVNFSATAHVRTEK